MREGGFVADQDVSWMRLALAEAERGRGAVEPNPMVGAVVVREDTLVSLGHHARFGGPHAEAVALRAAGDAAQGATLYVTLEPCCHHGKTPPCTDAILATGIRRVVVAVRDPFPKVAGGGIKALRDAGVQVDIGIEADSARRLLAPYLKRLHTGRPYVTAKWAMTLDGKTAVASGDSRWISGPRSRALVHEVRGRMDGILVGIGTVLADDPQLTARPPGPRIPVRIILDRKARLPLDSRLVCSARELPVWVVVHELAPPERRAALVDAGCTLLEFEGSAALPIPALLDELGRRGLTNLLVEGGGQILGAFLDAGEVDAVDVFIAPRLEGGTHPYTPIRGKGQTQMCDALPLEHQDVSIVDGDIRLQGTLPRRWLTCE